MKTGRQRRKRSFGIILLIAILTALSILREPVPCVASEPSPQSDRRKHVIVGIDVSTSMKSVTMRASRIHDVEDFLCEILYKRLPTTIKPPHSIDEELLNENSLVWTRPLYSDGDILTYFTFAESVAYDGLQRRKQFVNEGELLKHFPSYSKGFSGRNTFLETAYVAAYDSYDPRTDGEAFFVLVSDMERDRNPRNAQSEYIFQRYHLYQRRYTMLPCYALFVHSRIWITVYKITPLDGGGPLTPPPEPFQIVAGSDPTQRVTALRFNLRGDAERVALASPYLLTVNPELKGGLEILDVFCTLYHVSACNPLGEPRIVCRGAACREPVKLESLVLDRRFISHDYRLTMEIKYRSLVGDKRPEVYKIDEVTMEPESSCDLCLSDRSGECQLPEPLIVTEEGSLLKSSPLRIIETQGRATGSCKLKNLELFIRSKKFPDAVAIEDPGSGDGPLPTTVRLSLTPQSARDLPRCDSLKSVLQVHYEEVGATKPRIKEIPFVLKIIPPEVASSEVNLTHQRRLSGSSLSFEWSNGALGLAKHYLVAKDGSLLGSAEIKKVTVKVGSAGNWEFTDVPMRGSAAPINFQVSDQQVHRLLDEKPSAATVEILYYSDCFKTDKVLSFSVPVIIPKVECPEDAFWIVQDTGSHDPARQIEIPRDNTNSLKTPSLILAQNPAWQSPKSVSAVEGVQLRVKDVTKTWGSVDPQTLPQTLQPQAFSLAEAKALTPGEHRGEFIITYGCLYGFGASLNVVQPVSMIVPALVGPQFALTDKNRQPLTALKVTSFFGNASVDGLFLGEKSSIPLGNLGVAIKEIQVSGEKDTTVWQSWKSVTDLPFALTFRATGLRSLPREAGGRVPVQVKVTYEIMGIPSPIPFTGTISLEVRDLSWIVFVFIFLVLAGAVGSIIWWLLKERKVLFYLNIIRPTGGLETTDWYALKKGQKLLLYPGGSLNCPGLNCQECWIENRGGELFIVRRGDPGERVFEGLRYDLPEDGEEISIEIFHVARKDAGPESPPSTGSSPPDW